MASVFTTNLLLPLPNFDASLWQDDYYRALRTIDAALGMFVKLPQFKGTWTNSTAYVIGDLALDNTTGQIYKAAAAHTSAASGTFAAARLANPAYWTVFNAAASNRGAWKTATSYLVNDFVVAQGSIASVYAICVAAHTSTGSFSADLTSGYWVVLIDFGTSLTWGGTQDFSNATEVKVPTPVNPSNPATKTYADALITALTATISSTYAPIANPTFTGTVTVPTPTAPGSAANRSYVDGAAFTGALPGQVGNSGLSVVTNGQVTGASWGMSFSLDQYRNTNGVM